MIRSNNVKRRHIRFKTEKKYKVYILTMNSDDTIKCGDIGTLYDLSLGEMGIIVKTNFQKGQKLIIQLEEQEIIENVEITRIDTNFIGIRFEINPKNNNIVFDFVQHNMKTLAF